MNYSAPRNGREATPHWLAAKRGILLLPFCPATGQPVWPPPSTLADGGVEWWEVNGTGIVASFSVAPVQPEWKDQAPDIVDMIQLDDGPRLLSHIVVWIGISADPNRHGDPTLKA